MKIHLTWNRITAAAMIAASTSVGGSLAHGQYNPYAPAPQYSTVAPYGVAPAQSPVYPTTSASAGYAPATQPSYVPATQQRYAPTAQSSQQAQYQPPQYQPPAARPTYPQIARRMNDTTPSSPAVLPPQTDLAPTPAASGSDAAAQGYNGVNSPYPSTDGYYASDPGCTNGTCGGENCGVDGYTENCDGGTQWFGGYYGLWMTRDNPDYQRYTVQFDTPSGGYPYYPTADVTVLSLPDTDHDYRPGGEIRFGCTFSTGGGHSSGCDPYGCSSDYGYGNGCNTCAAPDHAWEVGYWILDDDINSSQAFDSIPTDTNRMYGMKNFAGLQYNGEPVNLWYDYQVPVEDPTGPPPWGSGTEVRILAQRVRTNFQAQNLELNLYRLPVYGVSTCGVGDECAPACRSPFNLTALCGFRYLRIDDDFQYATMWGVDSGITVTPPAYTPWDGFDNELYYDINVDNHLTGFQLGGNMNYAVSCNCNVFWNNNFGLYNNHVSSYQRVYGELGNATWVQSGEDATVQSSKNDIAFIGEMQLGGTYALSPRWRGILAYRAVAVSGIALSVDQMPGDFSNEAQVALIDSDGSLVIHGVQAGFECCY